MKYSGDMPPPVLTYSSNRPLDLQEKVITMIKKSVNMSAKNLRDQASVSKQHELGRTSPSRNSHLQQHNLTEHMPSKLMTSTVTNSFLDNSTGDGFKEVTFYSSTQKKNLKSFMQSKMEKVTRTNLY